MTDIEDYIVQIAELHFLESALCNINAESQNHTGGPHNMNQELCWIFFLQIILLKVSSCI